MDRLLHLCVDTWTSRLHHRGIPMVLHLLPETRTKPVEFGTYATCQSHWLLWRVTWEPFGLFATHQMEDSWPWQSLQTSSMFLMWKAGIARNKKSTSLGRYRGCHSVRTRSPFSLVFGIEHTVAFWSLDGVTTTHTLIPSSKTHSHWCEAFECSAYWCNCVKQ